MWLTRTDDLVRISPVQLRREFTLKNIHDCNRVVCIQHYLMASQSFCRPSIVSCDHQSMKEVRLENRRNRRRVSISFDDEQFLRHHPTAKRVLPNDFVPNNSSVDISNSDRVGHRRLLALVKMFSPRFLTTSQDERPKTQERAIEQIIETVHKSGGYFVFQTNGIWFEAHDAVVVEQIRRLVAHPSPTRHKFTRTQHPRSRSIRLTGSQLPYIS